MFSAKHKRDQTKLQIKAERLPFQEMIDQYNCFQSDFTGLTMVYCLMSSMEMNDFCFSEVMEIQNTMRVKTTQNDTKPMYVLHNHALLSLFSKLGEKMSSEKRATTTTTTTTTLPMVALKSLKVPVDIFLP